MKYLGMEKLHLTSLQQRDIMETTMTLSVTVGDKSTVRRELLQRELG